MLTGVGFFSPIAQINANTHTTKKAKTSQKPTNQPSTIKKGRKKHNTALVKHIRDKDPLADPSVIRK